jgi:hypothetical protein
VTEYKRGRDGGEQNKAATAFAATAVTHAGAGDTESRVVPAARTLTDPESPTAHGIADTRAAQVHPERS